MNYLKNIVRPERLSLEALRSVVRQQNDNFRILQEQIELSDDSAANVLRNAGMGAVSRQSTAWDIIDWTRNANETLTPETTMNYPSWKFTAGAANNTITAQAFPHKEGSLVLGMEFKLGSSGDSSGEVQVSFIRYKKNGSWVAQETITETYSFSATADANAQIYIKDMGLKTESGIALNLQRFDVEIKLVNNGDSIRELKNVVVQEATDTTPQQHSPFLQPLWHIASDESNRNFINETRVPWLNTEDLCYQLDNKDIYRWTGSAWETNATDHSQQHALDSTADHTSGTPSITQNNLMDADSNGLPDDSGISVTDVSGAVSASHTQGHVITSPSDHTSSATDGQILKADVSGLPVDATISDTTLNTIYDMTSLQNGFPNRTDSVITWSDSAPDRTLTIAPSASTFDYYMTGVKYTKSSSETIQITDSVGLWLFWYNGATLTSQRNPTSAQIETVILTKAWVALVYWDAVNNKGKLLDERHGISMAPKTHRELHFTIGTTFFDGLALGDFSIDGDGSSNSHAQFSVSAGQIFDQDIKHTINAINSTTGLEVWYRYGMAGDWIWDTQAGYSVLNYPSGRVYYDNTGTLTEVTDGKWVLYHIFAWNAEDGNPIAIMGQAEYPTKKAAQLGAVSEINSIFLGALPSTEMIAIATVIFQTKNTYGNAVKARIVTTAEGDDYVDWRLSRLSPSAPSQDHGLLSGLPDDDHPGNAWLAGRSGGQTLIGSTLTGEDLTLKDNSVDNNTITVTRLITAYDHSQDITQAHPDYLRNDVDDTTSGNISFSGGKGIKLLPASSVNGDAVRHEQVVPVHSSRVRVYLSAGVSIPANTATKILFNSKNYDGLNEFDPTSNYRFTATNAGRYLITLTVIYISGLGVGTRFDARLYKNGAPVALELTYNSANAWESISIQTILELAATDYIESWTYHTSATAENLQHLTHYTSMSVHRLS